MEPTSADASELNDKLNLLSVNEQENETAVESFVDEMTKNDKQKQTGSDDTDDFFGSDDNDGDYEASMRKREFEHLERLMQNIGYREGVGEAVDHHRQVGFERGMIQGLQEGMTSGASKGQEKAMELLRDLGVETDKISTTNEWMKLHCERNTTESSK